jgi:hypothetical protein
MLQPEDHEGDLRPADDNDWVEFNPRVTVQGTISDTFHIFTDSEANPEPATTALDTRHMGPQQETVTVYTDRSAFGNSAEDATAGAGSSTGKMTQEIELLGSQKSGDPRTKSARCWPLKKWWKNAPQMHR